MIPFKEWKQQKINVLQSVLDDHNVTAENVKERCRMSIDAVTREERLYIDNQLVITIKDRSWVKHYEKE